MVCAVSEGRNEAAELQEGEEDALLEQKKLPEQHGKADTADGRKRNTSV